MATLRGVWAGNWASTWAGVLAVAVIGAILATAARAEDEPAFVRERGDLDRLAIRGAETFSEVEIKQALAVDIDVAVAARPDAPLETLRNVLAEKTLAGYRFAGFADATAKATFDPAADQLVLEIHEGPRYLAGEVVIEGLDASLADRVREALTVEKPPANAVPPAPQPGAAKPKKKVVWSVGEAARLDLESQNRVREKVESALYDCGRLLPQFNLELVPDRVQHTVALKLQFTEPGAAAQIDELSVIGNKKFSSEEILEFLGIQQGSLWTGEMPRHLERRLKQSGRFTKVKVYDKQLTRPGVNLGVSVNLTEYAKAPSLSESLSREEQALVQLSRWLADFPKGEDDLVIEFKVEDYEIEAVVSPKLGALVLVRKPLPPDAKQPAPVTWAFVTSDERIGFYSAPRGRKLVAIPTPTPVVANFQLSLHEGPPKFTGQGTFQFGLGMVSSGKRNRRRHCEFRFNDTPVSLLSLAHEYDSKLTWEGDVLTVEFRERSLKFNGQTGRLIEFAGADEDGSARMSVAPGQFALKLAELDAATHDLPNEAAENAERPLSSVLEFLADEALAWKDQEQLAAFQPQLQVLRKLVSLGLLKPLDRLGVAACKPPLKSGDFGIPYKSFNFNFSGFQFNADWFHDAKVQATLRDLAEIGGLQLEPYVLPSGRWAQGVYRAVIYAQAKKGAAADRAVDLTKLCASSASGPLCCLSAAAAATEWPLGIPASLIANLGKTKLTLAEFQNDYRPLLDGKSLVGECLLCLAEVLRGLEADEVETLLAMLKTTECLDQHSLDALSAVAAVLRQHREGPVDQALAASLDQLWRLGLREQLAKWLEQLADEPKSPSIPAAPEAPGVAGYGVYQAAPYGKYPVTTPYWVNQGDGSLPPALVGPLAVGIGDHQGAPYGAYPVTPYGADQPAPGEPASGYYGAAVEAAPAFSPEATEAAPIALDGYCPVTLVEKRMWRKGKMLHSVTHYGRLFFFASADARETFLKYPDHFAPEMLGHDVVQFAEHMHWTRGKREFGVFYQDQIWLFESEDSRRKFKESPETYMAVCMATYGKKDVESQLKSRVRGFCENLPGVSAEEPTDDSADREKTHRYGDVSAGCAAPAYAADAYSEAGTYGSPEFPATDPNDARAPQAAAGDPPLALDGYSAVTLVELHSWRPGDRRYREVHRGRLYLFASEFERTEFAKRPERYCVGNDGFDIAEQVDHRRQTPGRREFGLFSSGRILLFASAESRARFKQAPWLYEPAISPPVPHVGADRYGNHPPVTEPAKAAASAASAPKKPLQTIRVGRRRAFGRRLR